MANDKATELRNFVVSSLATRRLVESGPMLSFCKMRDYNFQHSNKLDMDIRVNEEFNLTFRQASDY